jgi:malonyl-CoA O-methyltransferase
MDKARIKRAFSRAAHTYDECGTLQSEVGRKLEGLIPDSLAPRTVLDVGCGTGGILAGLKNRFPGASVVGCDIALAMLGVARRKAVDASARFVGSDFERLAFKDGSIDLAVSNLAYQWSTDMERALAELSAALSENGGFVMSTLGPATLMELKTSFMNAEEVFWLPRTRLMNFIDMETLKETAGKARLDVAALSFERVVKEYADFWELLRSLKGIGAANPNISSSAVAGRALLKETARTYKEMFPSDNGSGIRATYDIIYMTARKRTVLSRA